MLNLDIDDKELEIIISCISSHIETLKSYRNCILENIETSKKEKYSEDELVEIRGIIEENGESVLEIDEFIKKIEIILNKIKY